MKLEICRRGVEVSDEMQSYVERRLLYALGRFSPRISRVAVYLADLNGPRGGLDKCCRLVVRLPDAGVVAIEDRDAELTVLIDRAADRLARSVQRTLERKRIADFRQPA
ncbi:MAG: HPF/RaiA family ribosome-associated protein [Gemmataceae bacterium]|nr:HPF/RaiA family ribosome-associated protein [Gemmataceae bacterium]